MANERLINNIAVGVVFVQGPGSDLTMDSLARALAFTEVQEGLSILAGFEPDAEVTWIYDTRIVTLTQPIFPSAPWEGMPKSYYVKPIDAALYRSSNAKTYLFQGDSYIRLTGSTMDAGYPNTIASGWSGLPAAFQAGIDAAFENTSDGKIYMFKGDEYVRLTGTTVDATFPKPIAGTWTDLPEEFKAGIDAVVMDPNTGKIYMFKDHQYVRITGTTVDATYPKPIKGNFSGVTSEFEERIDAALWRGDNNKAYLFSHAERNRLNRYARFTSFSQPVDAGYPEYVGGRDLEQTEAVWRDPALASLGFAAGQTGIDAFRAQLEADHAADGAVLLFITKYPVYWPAYARGKLVISWDDGWTDWHMTAAHEVGHSFGGADEYVPNCDSCEDLAGKFFKVRNGNCEACATEVSMMAGYPKTISPHWVGVPAPFTAGIDAAVWNGENRRNYMFKGSQYVRLTGTKMDPSYPKAIAGNWAGLPAHFQTGIDAALWRRTNGKLYFFKGTEYVRLTGFTVDPGFPRTIASDWPTLPASFHAGIDAAVWRESNDKIYMFKGSQYCRLTDTVVDPGYPAPIAGNWQGLPSGFTLGVDAALMDPELSAVYLFKGNEYAKMQTGANCLMFNNAAALCDFSVSHLGWGAFLTHIDAAHHRPDIGKTYLFSGKWYVRYSTVPGTIDAGYPKPIAGNWPGLPAAFESGIDAALWRPSTGKSYFFKGNQYVRLTDTTVDAGYPKLISDGWVGLPAAYEAGIDAALWRPSNDKIYLFKGSQYVRLTENVADAGYPADIADHWPGLPTSFQSGIDAAVASETGQIYLFDGRRYVRYTNVASGVDSGYPKWIDGNWMPFPRG